MKKLLRGLKRVIRTGSLACPYTHAFSQEGEDMVLARVFEDQPEGFYVDVGAHHPTRFSNTYYFYLRGWRGINIDAMPGSMTAFNTSRPRDINLEIAVAEKPGKLNFHIFNDGALNTFDPSLAQERDGAGGYRIVEVREIEVQPLAEILQRHAGEKKIDFMSIDVEGLDMEVLRSNDWKRFSPSYLLIEDFSVDTAEDAVRSPMAEFLRTFDYVLFAKTVHTLIFRKQ